MTCCCNHAEQKCSETLDYGGVELECSKPEGHGAIHVACAPLSGRHKMAVWVHPFGSGRRIDQ